MNIPFLDLSRIEESLKERLKNRFAKVLEVGVFFRVEKKLNNSKNQFRAFSILHFPFLVPMALMHWNWRCGL